MWLASRENGWDCHNQTSCPDPERDIGKDIALTGEDKVFVVEICRNHVANPCEFVENGIYEKLTCRTFLQDESFTEIIALDKDAFNTPEHAGKDTD